MRRSEAEKAEFRKNLSVWFLANGRELPWRRSRDFYSVAVAEFMLQQTTVAAVIPYYLRWMERFPTVEVLAGATEAEVMEMWQGLGYYARGRNLLKACREVVSRYGGRFPEDVEGLRALPGFGKYTAGAVAAFAGDLPVEVIDVNIARVLARLGNVTLPVDSAEGRRMLSEEFGCWAPGWSCGGREFVSALMDLGALVCRPREPMCEECPVRKFCRCEEPGRLPVKRGGRPWLEVRDCRGVVCRGGRVGVRYSEGPWWKGLWLLPESRGGDLLHVEKFTVTRHRVVMEVVRGGVKVRGCHFFDLRDLPPMPAPHQRAIARVAERMDSVRDD